MHKPEASEWRNYQNYPISSIRSCTASPWVHQCSAAFRRPSQACQNTAYESDARIGPARTGQERIGQNIARVHTFRDLTFIAHSDGADLTVLEVDHDVSEITKVIPTIEYDSLRLAALMHLSHGCLRNTFEWPCWTSATCGPAIRQLRAIPLNIAKATPSEVLVWNDTAHYMDHIVWCMGELFTASCKAATSQSKHAQPALRGFSGLDIIHTGLRELVGEKKYTVKLFLLCLFIRYDAADGGPESETRNMYRPLILRSCPPKAVLHESKCNEPGHDACKAPSICWFLGHWSLPQLTSTQSLAPTASPQTLFFA
jgi:hypothetical protein